MNKSLVSIIILNFNGLNDTIRCIKSLKKTTYKNTEIIILDNGSENNEGQTLQKLFEATCKVIKLDKNLGFTGGNNWAVKIAKGKYVILLNNDTEVTPGWIEPLVDTLNNDNSVAIVQPKIKMLQNKMFFDYAGATGGFIDKYGYPFTRGRIFETKEMDNGQYDTPDLYRIFWASGACCAIRKSIIKKVGGLFDPIFFNYMEELDFCWRINKQGYKIYCCTKSVIYHMGASTAGKNLFKKRYWEHKNNLILLYKNLSHKELYRLLPGRLVLELVTYFYYLLNGNITYLKALFYAHMDVIKLIFSKKIKKNKKGSIFKMPFYPFSVLFQYHFFHRKCYSDLKWSPVGVVSLLIYNTKPSGGLDLIDTFSDNLKLKGYSVNIYSLFRKKNPGESKDSSQQLFKYFLNPKPNLLFFTFWPTAYLKYFLPASLKIYIAQDSGNFYKSGIVKYLVRTSYKLFKNIVTVSTYLKNEIRKYSPSSDIKIISTNPERYKYFLSKEKRKSQKGKKTIEIISIVSNYEYYKGIDILTESIKRLKKRNKNYKFTLVSREKYRYSKVFDNFFSNPTDIELKKLYQRSDFLLATSRSEGFFIPGLEAMATGCVMVSSNCGGIFQYAKDGYNAIIYKDPESIITKNPFDKVLSNRALHQKLIANGYHTAEKFAKTSTGHSLEKIVEDILKKI